MSIEAKRQNANRVLTEEPEHRKVLIDTLDGEVHRAYGSMPNIVYVISPSGKVRYRSDWNNLPRLEQVLSDPDTESTFTDQHYEPGAPKFSILFRVLLRAGFQALWHILKHKTTMQQRHDDADRVFATLTSPNSHKFRL